MREVVIVSAARTPVGSFGGTVKDIPAPRLGAVAIKAAVQKAGIDPSVVDEVIFGCVLPASLGQAPARQAALFAELPKTVECLTINKVCGSGLKAVMVATQAIQAGDADVIVAGGMENMDGAPYMLPKGRYGYRMGEATIQDCMMRDGLVDAYANKPMGCFADATAKAKGYTREAQDAFAIDSYKKALAAIQSGAFKDEIAPVEIPGKKGPTIFDTDEEPGKADFSKIPGLKPAFEKDGTVTAANASSINDGAAAVVVMAAEKAKALGLKPLARVLSQASFAQEPEWFTTAPIGAIEKALKKAGKAAADIDLWEINEAFAVVTMAAVDHFKLDPAKVNVNGGACAIGHPIGASGARVFVTLLHAMKARNAKLGLATLCIGGGEASALIVERV
jgi:acetyl-CoA C-acetyltransferase